ncbi:12160_t:CDS:2 [Entrophospora sp. SA101]|nr:12160_t:CDS:2 [Entrophospora sp. SA101]
MPTVNAYALATVFFVASYFFNWHALLSTDWLVLDIPPFNRRMSYGLFQVCTNLLINECRPFPSTSYRDCEEKYFCEEWILSSSLMVAASAIGGLTLLYLMFVLIGGRYARETSWKDQLVKPLILIIMGSSVVAFVDIVIMIDKVDNVIIHKLTGLLVVIVDTDIRKFMGRNKLDKI